jgi:glycosyltransferase involved in cell wall biosynthesis
MPIHRSTLIVEENNFVPADTRVWSEATTLHDAGWHVSVICPAPRNVDARLSPFETISGINIYRFPLTYADHGVLSYVREYLIAFLAIARLSWRIWRANHFDVIQFCNPPDFFFPIAFFYRLLRVRVIFDHHDLFPEMAALRYSGTVGKLLCTIARVAEFLTFQCANVVISTNQSYRRIAMQRGRVSADHIVVVRNGPKAHEFVPVEPVAVLKRGFHYLVCYVGQMSFEDGLLELVDAIQYVVCDLGRRDVLFALIGDGSVRGQTLAKATALGLESVIDMPGMIRDQLLLRQYLSTADVLIAPEPSNSLNRCSTFVKVGEYMAIGKPIVAYDLEETRYTAQEAAVYVPPGDVIAYGRAILKLLENPEQSQRMGEIGRRRILEQLSWEHQQQHLLYAYAIALSERATSRALTPS